jgi:hypothetical protein
MLQRFLNRLCNWAGSYCIQKYIQKKSYATILSIKKQKITRWNSNHGFFGPVIMKQNDARSVPELRDYLFVVKNLKR